jgi:hypothetical protein
MRQSIISDDVAFGHPAKKVSLVRPDEILRLISYQKHWQASLLHPLAAKKRNVAFLLDFHSA